MQETAEFEKKKTQIDYHDQKLSNKLLFLYELIQWGNAFSSSKHIIFL